jgi:phage shock protein E
MVIGHNWLLRLLKDLGMRLALLALLPLLLFACDSRNINTKAAVAAIEQGALIIDVRSKEEIQSGMLPNAIHIPHEEILEGAQSMSLSPDQPIVLYCRSGNRSAIALHTLESAGFTRALNGGGYAALNTMLGSD